MSELGMKPTSLKGLNDVEIFFVSRCMKGCKWPARAGHGDLARRWDDRSGACVDVMKPEPK